jgi:hypothetical protein
MADLTLTLSHSWEPVESAPGRAYRYPEETSEFLRSRWNRPAVYRWNVYKDEPGDLRTYAIGETDRLANRIYQYRNPTRELQACVRIKMLLMDAKMDGRQTRLEALAVERIACGEVLLSQESLSDRAVRKLLVQILSFWHERRGDTLLSPDAPAVNVRDLLR